MREKSESPVDNLSLRGRVLEIQRMSTEDGPGIRTTVFLKGCSMRCTWCHNPESLSPKPQLQWIGSRCIGCRTCLEICEDSALCLTPSGMSIDRRLCSGCGRCAEECPTTALEILGRSWTPDDLAAEVKKDKSYFDSSGGGLTLSGGEPALQPEFAAALMKSMAEPGIYTALDTCGGYKRSSLEKLLPWADLVLYDLKEMSPEKHMTFTGVALKQVTDNLIFLCRHMADKGRPRELWIRTPLIPGATARADNIQAIGKFIAEHLNSRVSRWELCAFNHLCRDKYLRLDMTWAFHDYGPMDQADIDSLLQVARASGVDPAIVHWTGTTNPNNHVKEQ